MSYILDALTKAAQQRDRQIPVVQRLLSPGPMPRSPWTRLPGRLLAALVLNAGLVAVLLVWWLRPVPIAAPPDPTPVISVPAPSPPAAEPSRPVRLEPPPRPDIQVEQPTPRGRQAIDDAPPMTASPKAPPPAPRSSASAPRPTPAPAATPPAAAAGPATAAERAGLKLEALIYSDLPAQRMVFINGRRFAEGDVIDGRLRVEEIQEDGVELSDQGRRFTLRVAR
jgi:Type II secretion system protein B